MPWTTANGISINYQLAGARGPAVVLLHEMGGTLDSWDAVAPALAESFRVLRYDQRGAGLSEKVRTHYNNDTAVDDLEGLLKGLDLPPPQKCSQLHFGVFQRQFRRPPLPLSPGERQPSPVRRH